MASGQETTVKVPADTTSYCHMKFPPIREDTLFSANPVLNESAGNIIDFYGPCEHDPLGKDEIRVQRDLLLRGSLSDSD
jgi:hypothetical protein